MAASLVEAEVNRLGGGIPVGDPPALSQLIAGDAIRIGSHVPDWRAAVRAAGDALVDCRATTTAYTDEMIATVEQLGPYIVIAPGIALAHSRPSPAGFLADEGRRTALLSASDPASIRQMIGDTEGGTAT